MCFGVSYAPNTNVHPAPYSPDQAYKAVTETQQDAGGKTATQLDPLATNTSGATDTQAEGQQPSGGGTGLTVGM